MARQFFSTAAFVLTLAVSTAGFAQQFRSDDPLPKDNDRAVNVPAITKYKLNDQYDFLKNSFGKAGDRSKGRAENINTVGEVPDNSWFQNRHGRVPVNPSELTQGPDTGNGPSTEQPWTVISAKTEGITPGFRIRDARGDVYFIKFDPLENPEMATAAEVISTKFFHAFGYNVPENYLTVFNRNQLRIDEKAKLTETDLDNLLKRVPRRRDGSYRALASKQLPGDPIGPFQYFGTRPDDPNDIFPHENRRELRGLRVFAAWLNHDDSRAINTLDMLAKEGGRRYVKHYLIDFGSTLGSGSTNVQKPRAGSEYLWEPKPVFARILTLGIWDRRWIHTRYPQFSSIGNFESTDFDPENWKPEYPNAAFLNMNDQDAYWAAKIVMSFTREEIQAIVSTGQLSDPEAEDYLVETLLARQRKIGRTWLTRISSFDQFEWTPAGELKFEHLGSFYDFVRKPDVQISWFTFNNTSGERHSIPKFDPKHDEGYFVASLSSLEGKVDVYVRMIAGAAEPQIVGVERQ